MKKLLLLLTVLCSSVLVFAQRQIKGKVVDEDGNPVFGASVVIQGTKNGTTTDNTGNFTLSTSATGSIKLSITNTGFKAMSVTSDGTTPVSVRLEKDVASLNDVVIIGYQTVKRKDLLASVSSISAKDLKDIPLTSAAQALNGRLAGVTATTSEGSPDADIRIRVRGGMSITGDNSPLYVVDGVQMENALNTIPPQDIQSIDVLKDASATAIYGARGANGVIIITTKSGRPGRVTVTYDGFVGIKTPTKTLDVLSPYDYVVYQSERSRGSTTDSTTFVNDFGHTWDTLSVYKNVAPIDWQDQVFGNTGVVTTHSLGVSGGSSKIVYNLGYTFNDEKAIVQNSSYRRHFLTGKIDYTPIKILKIGVSSRYTLQDVYGAGISSANGSQYNRLRNAVKYRPFLSPGETLESTDPFMDPNVGNGLTLYNPIQLANSEYRRKTTDDKNFTAYISLDITSHLNFRSTFGYDYSTFTDRQFEDSITPLAIISGGRKPVVELDTVNNRTITNSNVLTYSIRNWKGKHNFDFLVGQEIYQLDSTVRSDLFKNYALNTPHDVAFEQAGTLGTPFTGYPRLRKTRYTNVSFFGRINYNFLDRYLFSFNLRADGASKFAPGQQWGYFPAGSFAWRIKNEKFLQNSTFINDLKVRVGYGTVGNDRIPDYLYLPTFSSSGSLYYGINNQAVIGTFPTSLPNPNLKWESTVDENLGLDIAFFKNRFNLSVDVYNNQSKDLLLLVPIAPTYGYSNQYQNVGKTSNKGVEIQLNTIVMRKPNGFNWSANFNISFNRNNVVALGPNQVSYFPPASWGVSGQPTDYIIKVGSPVSSMYGLVNDGFYKVSDFNYDPATAIYTLKPGVVSDAGIIGTVMPGSEKFKDLNGDGIVDLDHDRQIIGNPNPKFTGGLFQQFSYKRWDASLFLNFSYGNDVYNANKIEFTNGYSNNANMLAIMAGRWKVVTETGQTAEWVNSAGQAVGIPPDQLAALNAGATIWQPLKSAGAFYPSTWAIEDGSFLRINNITIGYSFPVKSLAGLKMTKLRVYATVNNLAVLTGYSGYDPEVNVRSTNPLTQGLDYSAYPKSRSYIFGVSAAF